MPQSHRVGDYVFIGASKEDAEEIKKLNTFMFAGSKLEIVESEDGMGHSGKATESEETKMLRAKMQEILSARYVGDSKLLKLDQLHNDDSLVTLGMFENRDRALKTFKGLMAICEGLFKTPKEKREAIESISLASNNIDNVDQVESVALTFPQLKNLDMSGNAIINMQGFEKWKGKFKELETIFTAGNPIETTDPNFQATMLEWFPNLQSINGNVLRTAEEIAAKKAAQFPTPLPQHGPDFRDVNGIGENFLLDFFSSYDSDRPGLATRLYDESSQFSLAVDTQATIAENGPAPLPWSSYIQASRNQLKITSRHGRIQRLFRGANVIAELWKKLPLTAHPSIKDNMSKYIMDCHPLPGLPDPTGQSSIGVDGLIISVHGEFEECDQKTNKTGMRSFSRTFILGPGQPGRNAAGIRVVSDMLSLRAHNPLPNVFDAQVASAPAPAPAPAPSTASAPQNQQDSMIAELSKQTGMTSQYSKMCLEGVNWNFDQALVIFNEKKVSRQYEDSRPVTNSNRPSYHLMPLRTAFSKADQ